MRPKPGMRDRAVPTAWIAVDRARPGDGGAADSGSPVGEVVLVTASRRYEPSRPAAAQVVGPPDEEEQPGADRQRRPDAADGGGPHGEAALGEHEPVRRLDLHAQRERPRGLGADGELGG